MQAMIESSQNAQELDSDKGLTTGGSNRVGLRFVDLTQFEEEARV
jgi:hypothetical protein